MSYALQDYSRGDMIWPVMLSLHVSRGVFSTTSLAITANVKTHVVVKRDSRNMKGLVI